MSSCEPRAPGCSESCHPQGWILISTKALFWVFSFFLFCFFSPFLNTFKHFCTAAHPLLFYLLLPYWILNFPAHNCKKGLYFRVERGPHMWPIISISTCLPFSNSYCLLIGSCLAGGVLNSCHIRMDSLSYSELQFGTLIKRLLLFLEGFPPLSLSFSISWTNNSAQQGHYRLWIESWEC